MKYIGNNENIEGRLYQHDLALKTVQDPKSANYGKEFINGNIEVAVDEEGCNVIPVHFTYVTEMTNSGKKNGTFTVLKKIIEEGSTWIENGKDAAMLVKVSTSIGLNEFYNQQDELISTKRNEGGFVSFVNGVNELSKESERNRFKADMLITNVTMKEPKEGSSEEPYMIIKGAIFNFRKELLPVDFTVRDKEGIKFFEDADISNANPMYTNVWGSINCMTIVTQKIEESAFGEPSVTTYERKTKEWSIIGCKTIPYAFGDPEVLTGEEITAAMQDREKKLADIKRRAEEYKMQKASAAAAPVAQTPIKNGTFSF